MTDESGKQVGRSIGLTATNGSMTFSISAELFDADQQHTFNVLVGKSER